MSEGRTWRIHGGKRLSGTVSLHGNKNSALPAMAASLLLAKSGQRIVLDNVPRIRDVQVLSDILGHLGIRASWLGPDRLSLERIRRFPKAPDIPRGVVARIRGSIILLGPLAGIWPEFKLPKPGGDKIGTRPITAHMNALADLGVRITDRRGVLTVRRTVTDSVPRLSVWLTEQSVTATEAVLLYSPFLGSRTTLTVYGAACEPHIVTLCRLLSAMGARIGGAGSNRLTVRWPRAPRPPKDPVRLDDDFMEATTYAVAAAVTGSDLDIRFSRPADLELIDRYLRWFGVRSEVVPSRKLWRILGSRSPLRVDARLQVIKAEPWPRVPTDVMSVLVVLATQCSGTVKFLEYMYDDRFGFVQMLQDMGARISAQGPHVISVTGPTPLAGNEMLMRPDIRSGAAMLLAALAGQGASVLHDRNDVIGRGYQELPESLARLCASVELIPSPFR